MIKWGDRAKYIRNLDRPTASHSKQCPPTRKPSQLNEKPIAMSLHTSNLYEFGNHVRFPSYSKFFFKHDKVSTKFNHRKASIKVYKFEKSAWWSIYRSFINLKNPRDEAWKNKDMDRSNVPKWSGLCWHKLRIFLSVVRGWAEDPLAGFWN